MSKRLEGMGICVVNWLRCFDLQRRKHGVFAQIRLALIRGRRVVQLGGGGRRDFDAVFHACGWPGPFLQQILFLRPCQVGLIYVITGQLAHRLAAFERFQRNPKLELRRVPPSLPDHRSETPAAG